MDRFDYKGLVLSEGPLVWTKKLHLKEAGSQGCSYDPLCLILRNWFFTVKADQIPPRKMCPFAFPFISVPVLWYKMYFRVRVTLTYGSGQCFFIYWHFWPCGVCFFFSFIYICFEGLRPRIHKMCVKSNRNSFHMPFMHVIGFMHGTEICWF